MSGRPERLARWEWIGLLGLLGLALLVRLVFILRQQPGFYFEDSLDYDRAARAFLDTGHFDARYYRFPLYPLLMAASYRLFGTGLTPFRVLQSLFGVAAGFFVWRVGRRLFGARAGLLALVGAALFPVHVVLAGIEYPVAVGIFAVWAIFAILRGGPEESPPGAGRLAAAGLGVGLSCLLFEGGLVLGFFLALWVLFARAPLSHRLRSLAILSVAMLLVLAPWLVGMRKSGDYRALVLRAGIHLPTPPGVDPPLWAGSGGNLLRSKVGGMVRHPFWVAGHAWKEFLHFWDPYPDRLAVADEGFREKLHQEDSRMVVENSLVGDAPRLLYAAGFTLLLLAAAAGALAAGHRIPGAGFLVAWPVVLGLCYAPFFTQMRYRIPADPAFILLGAYALDLALQRRLVSELREALKALWEGWKRIALKIAAVQTFILLFLLFVVALGPIALLMKLFRKDPMHAPTAAGSFWALRERTREGLQECLKQF